MQGDTDDQNEEGDLYTMSDLIGSLVNVLEMPRLDFLDIFQALCCENVVNL